VLLTSRLWQFLKYITTNILDRQTPEIAKDGGSMVHLIFLDLWWIGALGLRASMGSKENHNNSPRVLLHIIFITLMTINDVNLYVAFRGVSGLNS
jgi:hypothetical protein